MRASGPLVHCRGEGTPSCTSVPHNSATILQDATRASVRGRTQHLQMLMFIPSTKFPSVAMYRPLSVSVILSSLPRSAYIAR